MDGWMALRERERFDLKLFGWAREKGTDFTTSCFLLDVFQKLTCGQKFPSARTDGWMDGPTGGGSADLFGWAHEKILILRAKGHCKKIQKGKRLLFGWTDGSRTQCEGRGAGGATSGVAVTMSSRVLHN